MRTNVLTPLVAAQRLSVSTETLRRWSLDGKLPVMKTAGGRRRYSLEDIEKLSPISQTSAGVPQEVVVGYARVSSHDQKAAGDLERQIARLQKAGATTVYRDVASGLSETRAGLKQMLRRAETGDLNRVLIVTRDRLARFGVGFIEAHLNSQGVNLTILESEDQESSPENELVSDMLSLIASFSGRLDSLRSTRRHAIEKVIALATDVSEAEPTSETSETITRG